MTQLGRTLGGRARHAGLSLSTMFLNGYRGLFVVVRRSDPRNGFKLLGDNVYRECRHPAILGPISTLIVGAHGLNARNDCERENSVCIE